MMSTQVQIMIVEDEQIIAMDLSMGLQQDGYEVVGIVDNFLDAVNMFKENAVDIILMDINIRGDQDGIACAEAILKIREVPIIFLTAFSDAKTIERVKRTRSSAFLTKPYSIANVRVAIELALHNFAEARLPLIRGKIVTMQDGASNSESKSIGSSIVVMNDYIFLKQGSKFVKIKLTELLYAESDNNYVFIITRTQKLSLRMSLSELLEQINYSALLRIHRSYAVNLHEIISFDDQSVKTEKMELPIGRNYKESFFKHFNLK